MDTITGTADDTTRADLEEAITHLAATAARLPSHWTDRRAAIHARINDLLDQRDGHPA